MIMAARKGRTPMTTTKQQLDEAVLSAVTGGTGPLDSLIYTGSNDPTLNPITPPNPGDGPLLVSTGEGTATATITGAEEEQQP
jgi:hypothetical protein